MIKSGDTSMDKLTPKVISEALSKLTQSHDFILKDITLHSKFIKFSNYSITGRFPCVREFHWSGKLPYKIGVNTSLEADSQL